MGQDLSAWKSLTTLGRVSSSACLAYRVLQRPVRGWGWGIGWREDSEWSSGPCQRTWVWATAKGSYWRCSIATFERFSGVLCGWIGVENAPGRHTCQSIFPKLVLFLAQSHQEWVGHLQIWTFFHLNRVGWVTDLWRSWWGTSRLFGEHLDLSNIHKYGLMIRKTTDVCQKSKKQESMDKEE